MAGLFLVWSGCVKTWLPSCIWLEETAGPETAYPVYLAPLTPFFFFPLTGNTPTV